VSRAATALKLLLFCSFLSRGAVHKRGLCIRAMSVRPSVRLSVTFVYCVKRTSNHILKLFSRRVATPFNFSTPNVMAISQRHPLTGAKIGIFDRYLAFGSMTAGPSSVVNISTVKL